MQVAPEEARDEKKRDLRFTCFPSIPCPSALRGELYDRVCTGGWNGVISSVALPSSKSTASQPPNNNIRAMNNAMLMQILLCR